MRLRHVALVVVACAACGNPDACEEVGAPEVHASAIPGDRVTDFILDYDDVLYYTDSDSGQIHRIRPDGVIEVAVANEVQPRALALDETNLYWVTADFSIRAFNKTTHAVRTVRAGTGCSAQECRLQFTSGPEALYFWESSSRRVLKVDKTTGTDSEIGQTQWTETALAVGGGYVYWTNLFVPESVFPVSLELVRVGVQGGMPEPVVGLGDRFSVRVIATDSQVVIGTRSRAAGVRELLAVTPPTKIETWVTESSFAFAVTANAVYLTDADELLIAASLQDGSTTSIACPAQAPVAIVASTTRVYWTDGDQVLSSPI